MRYDSYAYLWPPRPEVAFPPTRLAVYTRMDNQVAQVKMNGTCTVIFVSPKKELIFKTRHNTDHKAWKESSNTLPAFRSLPGSGWYVFVAELLHSKVPGLRDIFYIHELLVANGEYLVGTTFVERQEKLYGLLIGGRNDLRGTLSDFMIDSHTWLAVNHEGDFSALFKKLNKPEHEGLVLKTKDARLKPCTTPSANAGWQIKSRRVEGNKNYSF